MSLYQYPTYPKAINDNKYISISVPLAKLGKMISGWLKLFKTDSPLTSHTK